MANPYYIPPSDNSLMDVGKFGLDLFRLKQQKDIANRSASLTENEQRMRSAELFGDPTRGIQGTLRTNQDIARANILKVNADIAKDPKIETFGARGYLNVLTELSQFALENGNFAKKVKGLSEDPTNTKGKIYLEFINNPMYKKDFRDDIVNRVQKEIKDNPNFMETPQGGTLIGQLEAINDDTKWKQYIDQRFPEIARLYAMEEANTKAALQSTAPAKQTFDQTVAEKVRSGELSPEKGSMLLHPKPEPTPKTDFQTFMAGFERKPGETDIQYNKRASDEWEKRQDKRAMTKTAFTINMQNPPEDKFKNWSQEDKENQIQAKMISGKDPRFAFGDRSSYNAFNHEYNNYLTKHGIKASDVARMQADYKSGNSSLVFQRKNYDMMNGFAKNIDLQINKINQIYSEIQRTDIRLLDKPIRDLKVMAKGSGREANLASYLIEVSNEIGKMSTGSTASIRELSESAQKQWQKIHDPNLSLKELKIVLNGTRDQAYMRLQTTKEAMDITRNMITGIIGGNQQPQQKSDPLGIR